MTKRTSSPITIKSIRAFEDAVDLDGASVLRAGRGRRVDRRLLTIADSLQTALGGLGRGEHVSAPTLRNLYTRSFGTDETLLINGHRVNNLRVLVFADWIVRCALPAWLVLMPVRTPRRAVILDEMRRIGPVLYSDTIAAAIQQMVAAKVALRELDRYEPSVGEAAAANALHSRLHDALVAMSHTLLTTLQQSGGRRHVPAFAMKMLDPFVCAPTGVASAGQFIQTELRGTVPTLFDVLLSVKSGDNQRTVASRCVWPDADLR